MINIQDKSLCCGCSACAQKCPKQCIKMTQDEEGFLYPVVDNNLCINCGLCEKVCIELHPYPEHYPEKVFAVKNRNEDIRKDSSSGGLFTAIASYIIEKYNGIVFGVQFDEHFQAVFSYTESLSGLQRYRGSKYVQASVNTAYNDVEVFLKSGRYVLFCGTSCQVAGLKRYLVKEYEKLFTLDFICHGVPSPLIWDKYLQERIVGDSLTRIVSVKMRDKQYGWKRSSLKIVEDYGNKSITKQFAKTSYGKLFLSDNSLRQSCFKCPAKGGSANSDLTMADFWGADIFYKDFDDNKGITLAIINNHRIMYLLEGLDNVNYIEPTFDQVFSANSGYFKSVLFKESRTECFRMLNKGYSIDNIANKLVKNTYSFVIKDYIKFILERLGLWKK